MKESVRNALVVSAEMYGFEINPKSLTINKARAENDELIRAMQASEIRKQENKVADSLSKSVEEMTERLYKKSIEGRNLNEAQKLSLWEKARESALLSHKMVEKKIIDTGGAPMTYLLGDTPTAPDNKPGKK